MKKKITLTLLSAVLLTASATAQRTIPYTETFDSAQSFSDFITIDGDGNGNAWKYISWNQDVHSSFNANSKVSDWLLTPELSLKADRTYNLSFDAFNCIASTPELLEVRLGQGSDTTGYANTIIAPTIINNEKASAQKLSSVIKVNSNGNYRIAFHAISDADHFWVGIDNISVTENALTAAPDTVTNLKVSANAFGELKATVSFNAPAKDGNGGTLTSLSKIEISRDSTLLSDLTINNPEPGKAYSVADNEVPTTGIHTYSVKAYNGNGVGLTAKASAFIGQGIPAAPSETHITDNGTSAVMSWKAPSTTGADGRYVRVDELTYNIYDPNGNKVGSTNTTSWTLPDEIYNDEDQSYKWYVVKAATPAGEGVADTSSYVITGKPYELPFQESWKEGHADEYHLWWSPVDNSDRWNDGFGITSTSADEGYGQRWYASKAGQTSALGSGKISLGNATNPKLIFSYYAIPGKKVKITVMADEGTEKSTKIGEVDYTALNGNEGWRKQTFDLSSLKGTSYVVLRFVAEEGDIRTSVILDRIIVRDVLQKNMTMTAFSAPGKGKIGEELTLKARAWNIGSSTVGSYRVQLYVNGKLQEEKEGTNIASDSEQTFSFNYKPLVTDPQLTNVYMKVVTDGDMDETDDYTDTLTVSLDEPDYPTVTDLTATATTSTTAKLTWSAPEIDNSAKTDDFESYEAWSLDNVGKWTIVDGDRAYTYGLEGYEFPNEGSRIGFMVFNPSEAGIDATNLNGLKPHSGKQAMVSFSLRDNSDPVDDWLISPQLSGLEQTISFWAKSQTSLLPEKIEVRYSTTTTDTISFNKVVARVDSMADTWTLYSYKLPAGAKYFAIHSMANRNYMLMVDDATFQKALLEISGYGIYRDSVLIDTVPANATTYSDNGLNEGTHKYQVSVIYTLGESKLSNVAAVTTAINSIITEADKTNNIYTIDGRLVRRNAHSAEGLPAGVYIFGNKKIVVSSQKR